MKTVVMKDCREVIDRIEAIIPQIQGKSFLVAGATSFLGSSIVNVLGYYNDNIAKGNDEKCKIYATYHNKNRFNEKFESLLNKDYFKGYYWDATESTSNIDIDEEVDYIFYLCSIAATGMSKIYPVETIQANTIGLGNTLDFARKKDVACFLYFSSGAIYGAPQGIESQIFEYDRWAMDHLDDSNIYAEGKRAGETLCRAYFTEHNVKTKIVRISHTYGPGIDIDDGRIFSDFVKNIIEGENLTIKGDGSPTRPFCYITDALAAFFLIAVEGDAGEAYNLANPKETYSIGELAEKLTDEAFSERGIKPCYVVGKGNTHPEKVYVNVEKLCALGWSPEISVVEGFRRVVHSIEETRNY